MQGGFEAVRVTEWDEPQAVIGSYLQKYAYPDYYRMHVEGNNRELKNWTRGKTFRTAICRAKPIRSRCFANVVQRHQRPGRLPAIARRIHVSSPKGRGGFRVYDIASVANKGFSEPIVSAPFSPLGQNAHVASDQCHLHGDCRPTSRSIRCATPR